MNITLRHELPADRQAIFDLNAQAFGGSDESHLIDQLRDQGYGLLSLVAVEGDIIVGHIFFSRLHIETHSGHRPGVSLAPMAVSPSAQRKGIGSQLVQAGLEELKQQGESIVIVLGHSEFYPRFGFSCELAIPLLSQFSGEHWMAIELKPGALDNVQGCVRYAPPFGLD